MGLAGEFAFDAGEALFDDESVTVDVDALPVRGFGDGVELLAKLGGGVGGSRLVAFAALPGVVREVCGGDGFGFAGHGFGGVRCVAVL